MTAEALTLLVLGAALSVYSGAKLADLLEAVQDFQDARREAARPGPGSGPEAGPGSGPASRRP